jgi:hypothetical protein
MNIGTSPAARARLRGEATGLTAGELVPATTAMPVGILRLHRPVGAALLALAGRSDPVPSASG